MANIQTLMGWSDEDMVRHYKTFVDSDTELSHRFAIHLLGLAAEEYESRGVLCPEDLDESVHEATSSQAASVNNQGVSGQVEFLVESGAWDEDTLFDLVKEDQGRSG